MWVSEKTSSRRFDEYGQPAFACRLLAIPVYLVSHGLYTRLSLNFDSKLQRIALRFSRRFISTVSTIYLSIVDLVPAPRICEVASRSAGQPLAR